MRLHGSSRMALERKNPARKWGAPDPFDRFRGGRSEPGEVPGRERAVRPKLPACGFIGSGWIGSPSTPREEAMISWIPPSEGELVHKGARTKNPAAPWGAPD
jgi:hypothetical protein